MNYVKILKSFLNRQVIRQHLKTPINVNEELVVVKNGEPVVINSDIKQCLLLFAGLQLKPNTSFKPTLGPFLACFVIFPS